MEHCDLPENKAKRGLMYVELGTSEDVSVLLLRPFLYRSRRCGSVSINAINFESHP